MIGYIDMEGVRLRAYPARDRSFRVVTRDTEMEEYEGNGDLARREAVHRHMSNEVTSIDIAAQMLVDFPEIPWDLRMEIARQCWDETRHVAVLHRRLEEMGGYKGEFPIAVFEWCVTSAIDNIAGRLATQNRTLEAGAMDVVGNLIQAMRDAGDPETADVLEGILADEVQHVRFANRWIKELASRNPRVLMQVAMAVRFLATANQRFQAQGGEKSAGTLVYDDPQSRIPAINVDDRKLAEFNDDEIAEVLRQAGFRTLLPTAKQEARHGS